MLTSHPARLRLLLALTSIAALAAVFAGPAALGRLAGLVGRNAPEDPTFTITGDVGGLFPGAVKALTLTVTNPHTFAIDVTDLSAHADSADHSACDPAHVIVDSFHGSLVIAAHQQGAQILTVHMSTNATDACQNATFTLRYEGSAHIAGQPTTLDAQPAIVQIGVSPSVNVLHLRATLTVSSTAAAVPGRVVHFFIGRSEACHATTDSSGLASCDGPGLTVSAATAQGYTAVFDGDTSFAPSNANGDLVRVRP